MSPADRLEAMTTRAFELLIELDRASREPLRRQLETKLRAAIQDGSLPDGSRLPSSRSLAQQLAVSRGVVVDAYEQLIAQGFLISRQRQVPVVRAGEARRPAPLRPAARTASCSVPTRPISACSRGNCGCGPRPRSCATCPTASSTIPRMHEARKGSARRWSATCRGSAWCASTSTT
jgi:DNA-binding transcriptional regulator YhcF (GntR family)